LRKLLFPPGLLEGNDVPSMPLLFMDFGSLWMWCGESVACIPAEGFKGEALYRAYHGGKFL